MSQSNVYEERRKYLLDHSPVSGIYAQYDYYDMTEFRCDCYGDSSTYRVYGRDKEHFQLCEK